MSIKTTITKSNPHIPSFPMSPSLDQLANELLFKIFIHLDRPAPFSQSCRRLYDVTKDPHARAAYFLRKYGPRLAIFYAIRNHAKIVTKATADAMISGGAIVSRNLAQSLVKDYPKRQSGEYFRCCWASKLSFGSYLVFMDKAYELYGDNLWPKDAMDDWEQFRICVSHQLGIDFDVVDQHTHDTNRELVRELVDKYNVVPLPLQYFFSAISDTFVMISRIGDHQLLDIALNDLSYFDRYEFVNIIPTIVEKLIFNKPTPTHLKKALDNLFSYQYPVLEDLALELIRKCGLYKVPNVILETLIERKETLPFDLNKVVLKSINDKFHSIYSYNGAPDNIESLWHYFPEFQPQIRSNLNTLFAELHNGAVICNRNDASYYGYGVGCIAVDFILSQFGPSDPVTEQCFGAILKDICDKKIKLRGQRNRFLSTRGNNDIEGVLLQGSPQYFTKYVGAGVVIKPEHLRLVCEKGMKRKWFLEELFDALDKLLMEEAIENGDQGTLVVTENHSSLDAKRVFWKKAIEEVLDQEREKHHNINKKWSKEGRLYRMLDDFYRRHFQS